MRPNDASALVGVWELTSYRVLRDDGVVAEPLGASPCGIGVYTPQGTVSAQLMRPGRTRFGDGRRPGIDAIDPELVVAACAGYIAYGGTYVVDPAGGTVAHHVQCSLIPDWEGTVLTRSYEVSGDILVLRPPAHRGQQAELRWRRRTGTVTG